LIEATTLIGTGALFAAAASVETTARVSTRSLIRPGTLIGAPVGALLKPTALVLPAFAA
jgi:carbonic anhydrase/acetyltransferase-like protein (isoleucine patch superfamily)